MSSTIHHICVQVLPYRMVHDAVMESVQAAWHTKQWCQQDWKYPIQTVVFCSKVQLQSITQHRVKAPTAASHADEAAMESNVVTCFEQPSVLRVVKS